MFKAAVVLSVVSSGLIEASPLNVVRGSEFLQIEQIEQVGASDRGFCQRLTAVRIRAVAPIVSLAERSERTREGQRKVNGAYLRRRQGRREPAADPAVKTQRDSVSAFQEMTRRGYCHDYITFINISTQRGLRASQDYIYRAPVRPRDRGCTGCPPGARTPSPSCRKFGATLSTPPAAGDGECQRRAGQRREEKRKEKKRKKEKKEKKELSRTRTYLSKLYRGRVTVISARRAHRNARREFYDVGTACEPQLNVLNV